MHHQAKTPRNSQFAAVSPSRGVAPARPQTSRGSGGTSPSRSNLNRLGWNLALPFKPQSARVEPRPPDQASIGSGGTSPSHSNLTRLGWNLALPFKPHAARVEPRLPVQTSIGSGGTSPFRSNLNRLGWNLDLPFKPHAARVEPRPPVQTSRGSGGTSPSRSNLNRLGWNLAFPFKPHAGSGGTSTGRRVDIAVSFSQQVRRIQSIGYRRQQRWMHLSTRRLDDRIPLSAAVRKPKTAKNRHVLRFLVTDFPESCGGTHVMHPLNTRSNVERHNRIDKATTAPRSLIPVAEMHHGASKTLEICMRRKHNSFGERCQESTRVALWQHCLVAQTEKLSVFSTWAKKLTHGIDSALNMELTKCVNCHRRTRNCLNIIELNPRRSLAGTCRAT